MSRVENIFKQNASFFSRLKIKRISRKYSIYVGAIASGKHGNLVEPKLQTKKIPGF